MTTGRINQITILEHRLAASSKAGLVVRFCKGMRDILRQLVDTLACGSRLRTRAFVTCNQLGMSSESANERNEFDAQMQFASKVLRCKLTSSGTQGRSLAAGFAVMIDFQTLVTHNHTIICGSLSEGLTSSPCARHAQAHCHKKDCVCREGPP